MLAPGSVISHIEMSVEEGVPLQRGMNYRKRKNYSVILMSVRPNSPYNDQIKDEGRTLIYEGHDVSKSKKNPNPKAVDQPYTFPSGKLTQNGLFFNAAMRHKNNHEPAELVRVYEKIRSGIWVFNGLFYLVDAWIEREGVRSVYKFRLEICETDEDSTLLNRHTEIDSTRIIPPEVKLAVWKRDKGRCVKCGAIENLHFDHIIPYSKGGSSITAENIQLLCARHNLEKHDQIQ